MIWRSATLYTLLHISLMFGQVPDSTANIPETGYIYPKCDSLGIPLFIDGIQVGVSPLLYPVPVLAGFHEIGYAPPQIKNEYVKSHLHQAIKRIYVPIGDTVNVLLFFDHEYTQFRAIRTEHEITQYIGLIMSIMALLLIWKVTG